MDTNISTSINIKEREWSSSAEVDKDSAFLKPPNCFFFLHEILLVIHLMNWALFLEY